jgi:hypothetical protein
MAGTDARVVKLFEHPEESRLHGETKWRWLPSGNP